MNVIPKNKKSNFSITQKDLQANFAPKYTSVLKWDISNRIRAKHDFRKLKSFPECVRIDKIHKNLTLTPYALRLAP